MQIVHMKGILPYRNLKNNLKSHRFQLINNHSKSCLPIYLYRINNI